ncbi:protein FosB isoform X3 [Hyla sarda]|uniref:protein FosB isoform X3 n=1 Tax=Hyla sarda TaxID=327740 RepID=UPI0024C309F7|nr:protein FosB isoform X3 [Hyla sarda]
MGWISEKRLYTGASTSTGAGLVSRGSTISAHKSSHPELQMLYQFSGTWLHSCECVALCDVSTSFVPTVTAITSSQDLQWLVTPALISSMAHSQPPPGPSLDPYDLPGPSYASPSGSSYGTAQAAASSSGQEETRPARSRKRPREEALTPEEEEKRRVRRERNKLAAAKCRNRRRELTDRLQNETDLLEEEKSNLEAEIDELRRQKEQLEFALLSHRSGCKLPYEDPDLPHTEPATSFPHGGLLPSYAPQPEREEPVEAGTSAAAEVSVPPPTRSAPPHSWPSET